MSKNPLAFPGQQKAIFDSKVDLTEGQRDRIKDWLENYLPWYGTNDLQKSLSNYFDRSVKTVDDLTREEAKDLIKDIEKSASNFARDFASLAGYNELFPGRVKGRSTSKRKAIEGKLESPEDYYDRIRKGGGVYIPKDSDFYTEWSEGLSQGKKTQVGSRDPNAKTLDAWAEKFGMSNNELMQKIKKAKLVKNRLSKEEFDEAMQKKELKQMEQKEALREREEGPVEPQVGVDVDISGEPGEGSRFKKVQEIYEDLLVKEAGVSREELMADAWRLWRDWAGKESITEPEVEVPFYPGKKGQDDNFFGYDIFVNYPNETDIWDKDKVDQVKNTFSKAMSEAHDLHGEETDSWSDAIRMSYVNHGLYKPIQWIADRAWELYKTYYPQNWSRAVHHSWYEWATGKTIERSMEDPIV